MDQSVKTENELQRVSAAVQNERDGTVNMQTDAHTAVTQDKAEPVNLSTKRIVSAGKNSRSKKQTAAGSATKDTSAVKKETVKNTVRRKSAVKSSSSSGKRAAADLGVTENYGAEHNTSSGSFDYSPVYVFPSQDTLFDNVYNIKAADADVPDMRCLELLSESYPNKAAVFSEIINLKTILQLPKGTEHFVSDLHGAYESFRHIMNSCSGVIREKTGELFPDMPDSERSELCTLIYYPEELLSELNEKGVLTDLRYRNMLNRLIALCRYMSSKYTRSKVRKAVDREYAYIIDELLHAQDDVNNGRAKYHASIIDTILQTRVAYDFTVSLCELAKRLAVDHLHVVGDIFDRGPSPDKIMKMLMNYHSLDIQWGNHDILWMGAACGSEVCMATVIKNTISRSNCELLESGYGISLRNLAEFAAVTYMNEEQEDLSRKDRQIEESFQEEDVLSLEEFNALGGKEKKKSKKSDLKRIIRDLLEEREKISIGRNRLSKADRRQMQKAITVIALKLQGQLIRRNPGFNMSSRLLLEKMDLNTGTVELEGKKYRLNSKDFPTVDPASPYELSAEEKELMQRFKTAFLNSDELQREVAFLFSHGSLYKTYNGNLLFHGCVPMTEDGDNAVINCDGKKLSGKAYLDYCEQKARRAYHRKDQSSLDFMYYLWCGYESPLSGRIMKPFERAFIDDKEAWKEPRNPYYLHYFKEEVCRRLLSEFALNPDTGHIINGHTPIKVRQGESPIRGNGRLFVIDGGMCSAYYDTTGIAGFTLIATSHGMLLQSHKPFRSTEAAVKERADIDSSSTIVESYSVRRPVADTDTGVKLKRIIRELEALLDAYRQGILPERDTQTHNDRARNFGKFV